MRANAPLLVFGFGNPSRGDDALGPEFVRLVEARFSLAIEGGALEVLTDFQLQVEHVLDLEGRERVFFVDASATEVGAYSVTKVVGAQDKSFTTHLLSPAALLHTFAQVVGSQAPECWLIAIAGQQFELGAPMSERAQANLDAAIEVFGRELFNGPDGWIESPSELTTPDQVPEGPVSSPGPWAPPEGPERPAR